MTINFNNKLVTWSLLVGLVPGLSGCFTAAVVGVGAGVLMVSDRRTSDTYLTDEAIELRALNGISEKYNTTVHVNVTSFNRMVLITGEVPDAAIKADVSRIVESKPNVKAVQNELKISGSSGLGARSNDTLITSKVKGRFVDYGKFSAHIVKVVTEGGIVYLMGLVTRNEGDAATEIARSTSGVLSVVRLFEYISEDEAKRLDNRPTEEPKAQVR